MLTLIFENGRKYYKDIYGNKYQYNLASQFDKQQYQLDLAAQMRDEISLTPTRDKVNGGGIYDTE